MKLIKLLLIAIALIVNVGIAAHTLDFIKWRTLFSELERIILNISGPPFNVRLILPRIQFVG